MTAGTGTGFRGIMSRALLALAVLALTAAFARAQGTPPLSDFAKDLVGTGWEISNSDRDKRCPVTFSVDPAPGGGGFKLELDPACTIVPLKQVVAWMLGPKDVLRLVDSNKTPVFEFAEVESGILEAERKGEGLYFMQTQAAIKAEIRNADQLFGEWQIVREQLVLSGRSGSWRFSESDPTTWERTPLSTDPLLLMKQ